MSRHHQRRGAVVTAKAIEKKENHHANLWLLGSLPLLAMALISVFALNQL